MKKRLFIDLDNGTIEEAQKLTTLWKQFQPIVINNLSKEEDVPKQKETKNFTQQDWDELMEKNRKATEETYKNWIPKPEVTEPKSFVAPAYLSDHPMCKKEEPAQKDYEILSVRWDEKPHNRHFYPLISTVKRLSDNTAWALGGGTQYGIINKIDKSVDEKTLVFYVGENNYPAFIYELQKP